MFELKESKKIELLDVDAQIYKHSKFNTQHIHLDADNDEKVFMVAFRTIPEDSTGVAHILELLLYAVQKNIQFEILFL